MTVCAFEFNYIAAAAAAAVTVRIFKGVEGKHNTLTHSNAVKSFPCMKKRKPLTGSCSENQFLIFHTP